MARGDVVTVISTEKAQNDTTDAQPSSGVETMFMAAADIDVAGSAPYGGPSTGLGLIDGTNDQSLYWQNSTTAVAVQLMAQGKFLADNTRYFQFQHQGASTGDYGFALITIG